MKKFLAKLLLSKEQRAVIWNALRYSEYRYRRHGRVNDAVRVKMTMKEVGSFIANTDMRFSAEEVEEMLQCVSYNVANAVRQDMARRNVTCNVVVKQIIDRAKCEQCEHKAECAVYDACFGETEKSEVIPNNATEPTDAEMHTDADLTQKEAEDAGLVENENNSTNEECCK